jgi:hypothetical protein
MIMSGQSRLLQWADYLAGRWIRIKGPRFLSSTRRGVVRVEELEGRVVPTLLGQQLFPLDNAWNQNISNAPVAANSAAIIAHIGAATHVVPDWTAANPTEGSSPLYGIPFNIVHGNSTAKVNVVIDNYPGESDNIPVPIPANAVLEGDFQNGPNLNGGGYNPNQRGDSHLIVWDEDNNIAYELFGVSRPSDPTLFPNTADVEVPKTDLLWHAAQETVWNMNTDAFRTLGATSADAAGLSILAGLARPDEALPASMGGQGAINHALAVTLPSSDINPQYIYPAAHMLGTTPSPGAVPLGTRLRLQNNPTIDTLINNMPPQSKAIALAMQQYGLIVSDVGSAMYVSGTPATVDTVDSPTTNLTWNLTDLFGGNGIESLNAGDFQVVNLTPIMTGLSASSAAPGSTITVFGQNFSGAAGRLSVLFGSGNTSTAVSVLSDTQLSVLVPSGSGTVNVMVQSGLNEPDNLSSNPNANVNAPIFGYGVSTQTESFTFSALQKATPTISVSGGPFTYDGNPHAATVTVTGSVPGDPSPSGTIVVTYVLGSYDSTTPPTSAGVYTVNVNFTSSDSNYTSAMGTGSLTITPAMSTVSAQTVKALQNISTGSVLLAAFSVQTGQALSTAFFSGSINWADFSALDTTTFNVSISGAQVQVFGSHTYTTGGQFNPAVTLTYLNTYSVAASPPPTVNVGSDVTSSVTSKRTAPIHNLNKASSYYSLYQSTITVTNASSSAINGSLEFALTGLSVGSPGVALLYATVKVGGVAYNLDVTTDSAGDPVIFLSSTLVANPAPGKSVGLTLYFSNPAAILISYIPRVYSDPFDS